MVSNAISKAKLLDLLTLNDPIEQDTIGFPFSLLDSLPEIKNIQNEFMKHHYFNRKKIKKFLYDNEETISLDDDYDNITNKNSNLVYLTILLEESTNIVDYVYELDFIKKIKEKLDFKNDSEKRFENIIILKIILNLISNYQGEDEKEAKELENDASKEILKYIDYFKSEFKLKWEIKDLKEKGIEQIYIDIINNSIINNRLDDDNIMNQLDLINLNLTKVLFNGIKKIINEYTSKNMELKESEEMKELFNENNIKFYYVLFKYILKSRIYLYQIPFFVKLKRKIINKIKSNKKNFLSDIMNNNNLKEKFEYTIKFILDSEYYYNLYIKKGDSSSTKATGTPSLSLNTPSQSMTTDSLDDYEVLKFEKKIEIKSERIEKIENIEILEFIKELSTGYFIIGGMNDCLYLFDERLKNIIRTIKLKEKIKLTSTKEKTINNTCVEKEIYINVKNIIEIDSNKNDKKSDIIICSKTEIIYLTLNKNKYSPKKKLSIPCEGCIRLSNGNYLLYGEKGISKCRGEILFDENQKNYEIKFKNKKNYKGGIKIEDDLIALTSNEIFPNGENSLYFYDAKEEKIIEKVKGFSFVSGINGLFLAEKENEKILLCGCKDYDSKHQNGILLMKVKNIRSEESYIFINLEDFEVNCFCQISRKENNKIVMTDFILVGGFQSDKAIGAIKLFRLRHEEIKDDYNLEFLEDIFFENCIKANEKIEEGFERTISCIIQSKTNGKILVTCWDGKVYSFSEPNINYYLNEW